MKKIYMTLALCSLFAYSYAQDYTVTLAVDMSAVGTISDTVCVAGNFQVDDIINPQPEWTAGVHVLTDLDGDMIYNLDITVPAGDYQYKYINGGDWGNNEGAGIDANCGIDDGFGNFNRGMTISSDTIIAYVYDACTLAELPVNTSEISTAASLTITPNPMSNVARINIENPEHEALTMTFTNLMGQQVGAQYDISNNTVEINRSNLSAGLYLITIQNEFGGQVTEKLLVR